MDGEENSDNLRVASFSAYLNPTDNSNFVLKLTGGVHDPSLDIFSPEETPRLLVPTKVGKMKTTREGEIGVFGADKYFNMKLGYHATPKSETRDGDKIEVYHYMSPNLKTPSVTSQSSQNSQLALLKSPSSPNKPKKVTGKGFFSAFACNGPCLDKKAVHVNEGARSRNSLVQKKGSRRESFDVKKKPQTEENFEFPIPMSMKEKEEEEPRRSIEVFGSQMNKKSGDIVTNLERKLSMLTWDAIPKSQKSSASTFVGSSGPCDDIQSDASSDLFEIDPLSGTGYHPLLAIQRLEDQYEPSEASIEWSVVTASAADFPAASDYDEKLFVAGPEKKQPKNVVQKEAQKSRSGGLLGCKDHKAVSVAEAAYMTNEKARALTPRKDFEFQSSVVN